MELSNISLIKNLLEGMVNKDFGSLSPMAKEIAVKDMIGQSIDRLIEGLNEAYDDVHFSCQWLSPVAVVDKDGNFHMGGFNNLSEGVCDDDEDDDENDDYIFMNTPLEKLMMKITYERTQHCNLGHTHRTRRFHCYLTPQITEISNFYDLATASRRGKNWQGIFVRKYLPDFFDI